MNCETLNPRPDSSPSTCNSLNRCVPSPKLCPSSSHFDHPDLLQAILCSFPTTAAKSSSAGSKWLHRLRSSKGFPSDTDNQGLEDFLRHERSDPDSNTDKFDPQTNPNSAQPDERTDLGGDQTTEIHADGDECGGLSNVLSELFYMGPSKDFSRIRRKKTCRKQRCPRICVLSTNPDVDIHGADDRVSSPLPLNSNNRSKRKQPSRELKLTEHEDEEDKGHVDLSGYSRTEVTVIDTSVPSWKFEKMLFRRKNVWRVRDKKGKGVLSCDRKKKKLSLNENNGGKRKKLKLCSPSSKHVDEEECMAASNAGHDGNKTGAAYEKTQNSSSQVQEKSFPKKQSDVGSSVILIKSIPTTSKRNGSGIERSSLKPTPKQYKA